MSTTAVAHIIDAFFRRWPIYLALLLGSMVFGVLAVALPDDEYTSTGSVFVDSQSLVTAQSGVRESGIFSFLSPAQFTSQELSGLVSTEVFMDAALVLSGVDLSSDPRLRASQIAQLRGSVSTFAASENLVAVSVTTPDPELSFRVANGIIEQFVQFQINVDVAESDASEEFFASLVEGYDLDLIEAQQLVAEAVRGVSDLEQLRPEKQLEVERLQEAENQAENRYRSALENLEASRLATLQTETDVRQSYSVFDPPVIPVEPTGSFFDSVVVLAAFVLLGVLLALVWPLLVSALNNSVVFPEDLGLDPSDPELVAVLPLVKKKETRLDIDELVVTNMDSPQAIDASLAGRTITFIPDGAPTPESVPIEPVVEAVAPPVTVKATNGVAPAVEEVTAEVVPVAVAVVVDEETEEAVAEVDDFDDPSSTQEHPASEDEAESAEAEPVLDASMVIEGYRILDLGSEQLDQMAAETQTNGSDTYVDTPTEGAGSDDGEA